jgi:hypothetical protein
MSKITKMLIRKYDVVSGEWLIIDEKDLRCDEIIVESDNGFTYIYALKEGKKLFDKTFKNCVMVLRRNSIDILLKTPY